MYIDWRYELHIRGNRFLEQNSGWTWWDHSECGLVSRIKLLLWFSCIRCQQAWCRRVYPMFCGNNLNSIRKPGNESLFLQHKYYSKSYGIKFMTICPGLTNTEILSHTTMFDCDVKAFEKFAAAKRYQT